MKIFALLIISILAMHPLPAKCQGKPLLTLSEDSVGSNMRTHDLQLSAIGEVTDERYDFTGAASDTHVVKAIGTLSAGQVAQIRRYALREFRRLPHFIDERRSVPSDSPTRSICIAIGSTQRCSLHLDYRSPSRSAQARRFVQVWVRLLQTLQEPRPNNSFKPNPLRSFKTPSGSSGGSA